MRTSLTTPPQLVEGYAPYFAAMQMTDGLGFTEPGELNQLPAFECLKSLDDLDEEADEDEDDEDLEDDEDEDDLDEDEDDDSDEDFDEDEDDDDDDEDEEEEDEDGGVKPLKM